MFIGAYTSFTSDAEFAAAFENHLRKLIERRIAARGVAPGDTAAKAWAQAPFRGLEAYEFEHAPIFFGQDEALAKAMLQLTGTPRPDRRSCSCWVRAARASPRSSRRASCRSSLCRDAFAGTAFLRRVVFRPSDAREGEDLFDALARRLTTQVSEQEGLSGTDRTGPVNGEPCCPSAQRHGDAGLSDRHRTRPTHDGRRVSRAACWSTRPRSSFSSSISSKSCSPVIAYRSASDRSSSSFWPVSCARVCVWVVATMRKDFWHRADETPELVRLSEGNGRLELLPPGPAQLSQMIRRPAEAAGVSFEVHDTTNVPLNEVISEEVAREPGALPLLSYLLDQLYRNDVLEAHGHTLTYATYESLGRLEGAIATKAEAVLERCAPEDRQALGSVLFFARGDGHR